MRRFKLRHCSDFGRLRAPCLFNLRRDRDFADFRISRFPDAPPPIIRPADSDPQIPEGLKSTEKVTPFSPERANESPRAANIARLLALSTHFTTMRIRNSLCTL